MSDSDDMLKDPAEFMKSNAPKKRGRPPKKKGNPVGNETPERVEASQMKRGYESRGTGKRTWKPANALGYWDKDPNFAYRWTNPDRKTILRRKREGWEVVRGDKQKDYEGRCIADGSPMDTCVVVDEMILMRLPRHLAESRKEYYREMSKERAMAGKNQFISQARQSGVPVHYPKR